MASIAPILESPASAPTPILDLPRPQGGPLNANRRFTPRVHARFIARPTDGSRAFEGLDISFGGLMCSGGDLLWPGNSMELDLILPGEHESIRVLGRVVELVSYRSRIAMRMRFESISQTQRKRIAVWMARRAGAF